MGRARATSKAGAAAWVPIVVLCRGSRLARVGPGPKPARAAVHSAVSVLLYRGGCAAGFFSAAHST